MLIAPRSRGFTIIELMIGVALLSLLLMLAMPTFTTMLQNAKLRGVAESILAGLQAARVEALKRNQTAEFLLTDDAPDPANFATFAVTSAGRGWAVRVLDAVGAPTEFVEGRAAVEGSAQASGAALTVQVAASNLAASNTIRFDGMGRTNVAGPAPAIFAVMNPAGGACKTTGGNEPMRCLQIQVTPGGRVRMCDPSVPAVGGDTRAC